MTEKVSCEKQEKKEPFGWKVEKIIKKGEYLYCIVREHPYATKKGYVLHHRIVMENHLGRLLDPKEEVHHINGQKHDNRLENLELTKKGEHQSFHGRKRGRMWIMLKCPFCKKVFSRERKQTFISKGGQWSACSASCRGSFMRMIQLLGRTPKVESAISENIVREYKIYSLDNPEETLIRGSVETIRTQAEMPKI